MAKEKGIGRRGKLVINGKGVSSEGETKSENKNNGKPCKHLGKAVRPQSLKRTLTNLRNGTCKDCRGKPKVPADIGNKEESELALAVCICLKCGYQGCSRYSSQQHAHKHFLERSTHTICINAITRMVWCYACDEEILVDNDNGPFTKAMKLICDQLSKAPEEEPGKMSLISGTVKGLQNLGNTCFFNSVLQNISQTAFLVDRLESLYIPDEEMTVQSKKTSKVEIRIKKGTPIGPLTSALKCFLDDFHSSSRGHVVPSKLFGEITRKWPQFRGYKQQDSQELLRYLLDGMHTEELKRIEYAMKEAVNACEMAPTKEQLKDCFNNAKTFVDEVFGGTLVSTIICSKCKTKSQVHDNFLDLSLPVNNTPRGSAKSVAARFLNGALKNEENSAEEPARKMSKHQQKVKARKEKKSKRGKGKSVFSPKGSEEGSESGVDARRNAEGGDDEDDLSQGEGSQRPNGKRQSTSEISIVRNDRSDQFLSKDEAGFVVIYRVSGSKTNLELKPKETMLGGNASKSEKAEKSSVESLVCGVSSPETGDLAASGCKDMPVREASPTENESRNTEEELHSVSIRKDEVVSAIDVQCDGNNCDEKAPGNSDCEENQSEKLKQDVGIVIDKFETNLDLTGDKKRNCDEEQEDNKEKECKLDGEKEAMKEVMMEVRQELKQVLMQQAEQEVKFESLTIQESNLNESQEVEQGMEREMEGEVEEKVVEQLAPEATLEIGKQDGMIVKDDLSVDLDKEKGKELTSEAEKLQETCDMSKKTKEIGSQEKSVQSADGVAKASGMVGGDIIDGVADIEEDVEEGKEAYDEEIGDGDEEEACRNDDGSNSDNGKETDNDELGTVSPEYQCRSEECSISSCLLQFTSQEVLNGNNKYFCNVCTKTQADGNSSEKVKPVFTEATKQMLLWKPPKVLTLHLKRFEQSERGLKKVNKHIEFPLRLDLSPFCHKNDMVSCDDLQYTLYGIVEHSGNLHGGHYVSCVKTKTSDRKNKWYYISDSRVSEVQEEAVLRKQAYMLFYHQNKR